MATPTVNGLNDFSYAPFGIARGLMSGTKWGGAVGTGITMLYSFPSGTATHVRNYGEGEFNSWFSLTATERAEVREALSVWSQFANIRFFETSDTRNNVGDMRFAYTNSSPNEAAHAYLPHGSPEAGDVWFNPSGFNSDDRGTVPLGSYDWHTILHEVGHAIGLKHPFSGSPQLPDALDNFRHTVMSYTASPWSPFQNSQASFYPTTPMYHDLVAIQSLYGRNTSVARGNNSYVFQDGTRYWQAINDGGGRDWFIYNGIENSVIDLRPGKFSFVSETIFFGGFGQTRGTVTIGPGVVIEWARGGSGNDVLRGNQAANDLRGELGNDSLFGFSSNDTLRGGLGNDKLAGGTGRDTFLFNTLPNTVSNKDIITDFNPVDDTIRLDNAVFPNLVKTGILGPALFKRGVVATEQSHRIIYNVSNGNLIYDHNGDAAGGAVVFAKVAAGLAITNKDFFII